MRPLSDHYRDMARNNAWSNARLLAACDGLTDAEFAAPRVSFFPSLQATLNHNFLVDRFYLDNLRGEDRAFADTQVPYPRAFDLRVAQASIDRELVGFCDALSDSDLARDVAIRRDDGVTHHDPTWAVLSHLFVHQIHHRGLAHAMLAGTSIAPPQLDEFFLEMDAPLRDPELRSLGLSSTPTPG